MPVCIFGTAAVWASAVPAGIMASSSGSAIVAPDAAQHRATGQVFLGDEMHIYWTLFTQVRARRAARW